MYIHVLLGSNELSCLFVYAHCSRHVRVVLFMLVERGELRNAQGCSAGSYLMSRFEHPSCSKYVTYAGYDVERESVYVYMQVSYLCIRVVIQVDAFGIQSHIKLLFMCIIELRVFGLG